MMPAAILEFIAFESAALALPVVGASLAFAVGRRHRARASDSGGDPHIATIETAALLLLALLTAFTLSMAQERYERRRVVVVDEANTIETAYQRAELLAPPAAAEARKLLRSYADARIELSAALDWAAVERAEGHARALHSSLWQLAASEGRDRPTPTTALFISAINDLIDLDARRHDLFETHLPIAILALLFLVAAVATAVVAYGSARSGSRSALALVALPLLVGAAICVVVELDRPQVGLINPSNQPMERVRKSLEAVLSP